MAINEIIKEAKFILSYIIIIIYIVIIYNIYYNNLYFYKKQNIYFSTLSKEIILKNTSSPRRTFWSVNVNLTFPPPVSSTQV